MRRGRVFYLLFWSLLSAAEIACQNKAIYCFDKTESGNISLSCDVGFLIKIQEAIYIRNKWNDCLYVYGDCTEKMAGSDVCNRQSDCTLPVKKIYSIDCEHYVSFIRVIYDCFVDASMKLNRTAFNNPVQTSHMDLESLSKARTPAKPLPSRGTPASGLFNETVSKPSGHIFQKHLSIPQSYPSVKETVVVVVCLVVTCVAILTGILIVVIHCRSEKRKFPRRKQLPLVANIFTIFSGREKRREADGLSAVSESQVEQNSGIVESSDRPSSTETSERSGWNLCQRFRSSSRNVRTPPEGQSPSITIVNESNSFA